MTVEGYLNDVSLWSSVQVAPLFSDGVEDGGRIWDPVTGFQLRTVYVTGFGNRPTRRAFNRYSRRDRFMTLLMDTYEIGARQIVVMRCFDVLLARWKQGRSLLARKYFLNLRVVNYLIPVFLKLVPPYGKGACLRDPARFAKQRGIFNNLMA